MSKEKNYKLKNISVGGDILSLVLGKKTGHHNGIGFLNEKSILALVI